MNRDLLEFICDDVVLPDTETAVSPGGREVARVTASVRTKLRENKTKETFEYGTVQMAR